MPIDHQHRLIFIHIPKAAGTAISAFLGLPGYPLERPLILQGQDPQGYWYQHLTLQEIRDHGFGDLGYKTFSFVRNPFDRVVSSFFWWKRKVARRRFRKLHHLLDYVEEILRLRNFHNLGVHFRPQWEFTYPSVDFLGRYESLPRDMQVLLGLSSETEIPVLNSTDHLPYQVYYTKRLVDRVRRLYAKDFETFGYPDTLD